jgi:hypothetical protein
MYVRLAHFSIQEYLVSTQILLGAAQAFALQSKRDRHLLLTSNAAYSEYCMRALDPYVTTVDHEIGIPNEEALRRQLKVLTFLPHVCSNWHRYASYGSVDDARQALRAFDCGIFTRMSGVRRLLFRSDCRNALETQEE